MLLPRPSRCHAPVAPRLRHRADRPSARRVPATETVYLRALLPVTALDVSAPAPTLRHVALVFRRRRAGCDRPRRHRTCAAAGTRLAMSKCTWTRSWPSCGRAVTRSST